MENLKQEIFDKVFQILQNHQLSDDAVLPENWAQKSFPELGFSSLRYVKVLIEIEDTYEIEFELQDLLLKNFECAEQLVQRIGELLDER